MASTTGHDEFIESLFKAFHLPPDTVGFKLTVAREAFVQIDVVTLPKLDSDNVKQVAEVLKKYMLIEMEEPKK